MCNNTIKVVFEDGTWFLGNSLSQMGDMVTYMILDGGYPFDKLKGHKITRLYPHNRDTIKQRNRPELLRAYAVRWELSRDYVKERYKSNPEHYRRILIASIPYLKRKGFSSQVIERLTEGISASYKGGTQ